MQNNLTDWRDRYRRAGLPAIPLPSGAKAPPVAGAGWPDVAPATQWQQAGAGFRGNLALLCGGGLVVVDCDAQDTERHVTAWRDGLGLDTATVRTPSGGLHTYLRCDDVPDGFTWATLALGPGELRARRCYVVAPPSLVSGHRYAFTHGQPERLATVHWRDLAPLIAKSAAGETEPLAVPPLPLVHRDMSDKCRNLLRWLSDRRETARLPGDQSRSEVEAGVVVRLILAGWPFGDILAVFEQYRPGHFWECGSKRTAYLEHTYCNMLGWLAVQGERPAIAEAYQTAKALPWPGRTGAHDRSVYLALLSVCWEHGSTQVYASARDLASASAKSAQGAYNALQRLTEAGLIQRVGTDDNGGATIWRVFVTKLDKSHRQIAIPGTGPQRAECGGRAQPTQNVSTTSPEACELWGWFGLGRSAGAVYDALGDDPTEPDTLAARTGKSVRTVYRALTTLSQHGLAAHSGDGWRRGPRDLADVALEIDAVGKHAARMRQIEHDRDNWRRLREAKGGRKQASAKRNAQPGTRHDS